MKEFIKFFEFDKESGKVILTPPCFGSEAWCLRSNEDCFLEFGIFDIMNHGGVFLEDGNHILQLLDLSESVVFRLEFRVKGRQVIVEDVVCNDVYKRHYMSVMPDRGIYNL